MKYAKPETNEELWDTIGMLQEMGGLGELRDRGDAVYRHLRLDLNPEYYSLASKPKTRPLCATDEIPEWVRKKSWPTGHRLRISGITPECVTACFRRGSDLGVHRIKWTELQRTWEGANGEALEVAE